MISKPHTIIIIRDFIFLFIFLIWFSNKEKLGDLGLAEIVTKILDLYKLDAPIIKIAIKLVINLAVDHKENITRLGLITHYHHINPFNYLFTFTFTLICFFFKLFSTIIVLCKAIELCIQAIKLYYHSNLEIIQWTCLAIAHLTSENKYTILAGAYLLFKFWHYKKNRENSK
jgi:hypothetical protein